MRAATVLLALAALLLSGAAFAADSESSDLSLEEQGAADAYHFPKLETDAGIRAGYRFTDIDGSREAAEYEYPNGSVLFGGEIWHPSFPHRLHLDFDLRSEKDYFGDVWYTYKDIFFIRERNSTFFHNLSNIDLDPFDTAAGFDIRDSGETYGLKTGIDHFDIRGKAPDLPLRVYVDGWLVRKSGDRQQRSLLGGAWFNDIVKSTQRRKIDFQTRDITVGISSHVGPIEIDYAHGEKRFKAGNDSVLDDAYDQSGMGPAPGMRPAGVYPHNLIPKVDSSVDTLRAHTSHTGKIVATATFQRTTNENEYSGAESEYFIGDGEIIAMPMPELALFLKYRHKSTDIDNPATVTITDLTNRANAFTYPVRSSISSTSDKTSVIARYRPLRGLTLKAGYHYTGIDREDADQWGLPKSSQEHTVDVSARGRIASSLQAKAEYIHRKINAPAHNTDPDSSDEGRLSITWLPTPRLSALLSYDITTESRDDLHFVDTVDPDNRDVRRDSVIGSITYQVLDDLSLTASYAYMYYGIDQDLEYHDDEGLPHTDKDVSYRSEAQSYALDVHYAPHHLVTVSAGINHTTGMSSFSPSAPALLEPEPISSFSRMRTKTTDYRASCQFRLGKGFSLGLQYQYADFDDDVGNPYDDADDGRAHIAVITLSKRW